MIVMRTGDPSTVPPSPAVLLVYDWPEGGEVRRFYLGEGNPGEETFSDFRSAPITLFCGAHAQLGDGRILLIGANSASPVIYDPDLPESSAFLTGLASGVKRYYTSVATLATGKVIAVGGSVENCATELERTPSLYAPPRASLPAGEWEALSQATHCGQPLPECNDHCFGVQPPATSELYIHYYPHVYQLRDGRIFFTGGPQTNYFLDSTWGMDVLNEPSPGVSRWAMVADKPIVGVASTMYGPELIMELGGTNDCRPFVLDLVNSPSTWQARATSANNWVDPNVQSLANWTSYLVALPNGKLLTMGQHEVPELYDPIADTWQAMAPMELLPVSPPWARGWHSAAGLLPDARVMIVGGDPPGLPPVSDTAQIFAPPYLFDAVQNRYIDPSHSLRPVVGPPPLIGTGGTFFASITPGSGSTWTNQACLIRPSSTQHSVDFDQRYLPLSRVGGPPVIQGTGQAEFLAPAFAEEAPPGYYMFFIVNDQGVPSVGQFVQVWGIVRSSVEVIATAYCQAGVARLDLDISWLTSLESEQGVNDRTDLFAPGYPCGSGANVRYAAPPDPNDRRKHRIVYPGLPCQTGLYRFVIRSYLSGTETTLAGCQLSIDIPSCPTCTQCPPPGCEIE